MKRMTIALLALGLIYGSTDAGPFKNGGVDRADLAELSNEALETLKDTEFAVFRAEVQLDRAKAAERRAADEVRDAKRTVDAENSDLKAARAETKAATANLDEDRLEAAAVMSQGATRDVAIAKQLLKWKEQQHKAAEAEVRRARADLEVEQARRDLVRAELLIDEGADAAARYSLTALESTLGKREKELEKAQRVAAAAQAKVGPSQTEWERLAGEPSEEQTEPETLEQPEQPSIREVE